MLKCSRMKTINSQTLSLYHFFNEWSYQIGISHHSQVSKMNAINCSLTIFSYHLFRMNQIYIFFPLLLE